MSVPPVSMASTAGRVALHRPTTLTGTPTKGIWYSDDGVPQPSVRERAAQRKRAERERKLLGQLSVLAGGGAHADADDGDESDDDDDDDYGSA